MLWRPTEFDPSAASPHAAVRAKRIAGVAFTPFAGRFLDRPRLHRSQAETSCNGGANFGIGGLAILDEIERTRRCLFQGHPIDRKSTRLNSSHLGISYAVF